MIKVLVVEDEYLVRKGLVLTTPWENYGLEVIGEAENGKEGLLLATELRPDLVITDIRMPKMDGLELIERLEGVIDAEYLIISGYNEFEYAKQAMRLGVRDYLLKPIDDEELYQILERLSGLIQSKKKLQKVQDSLPLIQDSKLQLFNEYLSDNEWKVKENYIREAIKYLKLHYREDLNIRKVADSLKISESYLSRLFKMETGYTFVEYLTNYRIKKAIELLKEKSEKVYEIAEMVGYSDSRYFSALFRKYVGVTPSEFKDGLSRRN
jgi:two-component system response regulator YesN